MNNHVSPKACQFFHLIINCPSVNFHLTISLPHEFLHSQCKPNLQVRERCRKVTEEKQSMEEKLAHKDEECEALKSIVIAAQKDGNINGLISAADSNLLLSKVCDKQSFSQFLEVLAFSGQPL